jgi:hypothetical protein
MAHGGIADDDSDVFEFSNESEEPAFSLDDSLDITKKKKMAHGGMVHLSAPRVAFSKALKRY